MPGTLSKVRKPPHNRCYGIEIECLVKASVQYLDGYKGFWFAGYDGSITGSGCEHRGVEYVSQPLPYATLRKQVDHLAKSVQWIVNDSCGIHVHVGKTGVSLVRLEGLANSLQHLTIHNCIDLFGRRPNDYCQNLGFRRLDRYVMINFTNTHTVEFRMFSSGDAVWAKECLRRTKLMVEYKGKVSYETLMDLFTKPE